MPCVAGVGPAGVGGSGPGLGSAAAGIGVAASPAAIRALARARVRGGAQLVCERPDSCSWGDFLVLDRYILPASPRWSEALSGCL